MQTRPIIDVLREVNGGKFLDKLADDLQDLTQAVTYHEEGGKLTITLNIKPATKGDASLIVIHGTSTVKAPVEKFKGLFYPTADNNLQSRNPNQEEIPGLRVASDNEAPSHVDTSTSTSRKV